LYTDYSLIPDGRRNYVRLLFTDAVIRGMHREWEHDARDAVAALRIEAAADPDDPEHPPHAVALAATGQPLARLVGELSVQDAEFRPGGPTIASPAPATAPSSTVIGWSAI